MYCYLHNTRSVTQRKCPLVPVLCQTVGKDCHSEWHSDTFVVIRKLWYDCHLEPAATLVDVAAQKEVLINIEVVGVIVLNKLCLCLLFPLTFISKIIYEWNVHFIRISVVFNLYHMYSFGDKYLLKINFLNRFIKSSISRDSAMFADI